MQQVFSFADDYHVSKHVIHGFLTNNLIASDSRREPELCYNQEVKRALFSVEQERTLVLEQQVLTSVSVECLHSFAG